MNAENGMPPPAPPLGQDIVLAVDSWLEARRRGTALERALVRNQAPFLVSFALTARLAQESASGTARATPPAQKLRRALRRLGDLGRLLQGPARWQASSTTAADLLAVCLQPNATRAFLPVGDELTRLGMRVQYLLDAEDSVSPRLVGDGRALAKACLSLTPRKVQAVVRTTRRMSPLWNDREGLEALLSEVDLDRSWTPRLRIQLRRQLLRAIPRGVALEAALRRCPASGVVYVTHRALLDELLPETHPERPRYFFLQGIVPDIPPIFSHLDVTAAFVGSEIDRPYVKRCGIPEARTFTVGYPDYDRFPTLTRAGCRRQMARICPAAEAGPLVVFTSQYATPLFPERARERNLAVLIGCARLLPDVHFVIKLHPRREGFAERSLPSNVTVLKDADTYALLRAADAAVTYWSTTALEAVLLGVPLVQLNATGLADFFDLTGRWGLEPARSSEELATRVRQALAGNLPAPSPELFRQLQASCDGGAAQRTALILAESLGSERDASTAPRSRSVD